MLVHTFQMLKLLSSINKLFTLYKLNIFAFDKQFRRTKGVLYQYKTCLSRVSAASNKRLEQRPRFTKGLLKGSFNQMVRG